MSLSQHDRRVFEAIVVGLCRDDPRLATRARQQWMRRIRMRRAAAALSCAAGFVVLAVVSTGFMAAVAAAVLAVGGAAFTYGASVSRPVPARTRLLQARMRVRAWARARGARRDAGPAGRT